MQSRSGTRDAAQSCGGTHLVQFPVPSIKADGRLTKFCRLAGSTYWMRKQGSVRCVCQCLWQMMRGRTVPRSLNMAGTKKPNSYIDHQTYATHRNRFKHDSEVHVLELELRPGNSCPPFTDGKEALVLQACREETFAVAGTGT
jgi:hypothetical protein